MKNNAPSFFSKVGGTVYVRTFLKSEKGITEEELEDAVICGACRTFIYNHVFRPERVKSQGSNRALPDTSDAAQAASKAAVVVYLFIIKYVQLM